MEQNQKNYKIPTIACEMCDEDVIISLKEYFGVGHINKFSPRKKHYKPSFRWRVRGTNAVAILKICSRYFSIRRKEKAKSLIKEYFNRRKHVV